MFYASLGLVGLTLLSGSLLTSSITSATNDSVVDEVSVTVPISCSLSGTGMTSHNAEIANGTYTADIGTTTLKAFCNDNNGFAIYAAGFTGDEVGGTNSNKLVGTSASNNATIETGLATSAGNPDTSNWAMKLAITGDSGDTTGTNAVTIDSAPNVLNGEAASFSSYHVVPNEYAKVAHKNSATNMDTTTGGVTLTTTYAAYISKTQIADTYSGQVIYTLVHPSDHAAPVFLNPNADNISEVNYMQQFAIVGDTNRQAIIDSMTAGQQYTVLDSRDGKSYTIAKFQTGTNSNTNEPIYDVWMTKNLDLDIDSTRAYTNEDTDIGYNTTTHEYGTASWTPTRSTYAATNTQTHEWCQGGTWNSEYGYCEANDTPESYDPGNLYWNTTTSDWTDWNAYYNSCDYSTNPPSCDQSLNPISTYTSSTGTAQYHLGNYYNWAAALATNDSSVYGNSDLVEQSICPAGWTLPRIGNGEDTFQALWKQYGYDDNNEAFSDITDLTGSPLYFTPGGYFDGNLGNVGSDGGFWSPVADGSADARGAGFNVDGVASPSSGNYRGVGQSVRGVARPVTGSGSDSGGGGNN